MDIDVQRDIYDRLLFHTGRFRRISAYRRLNARECEAVLAPAEPAAWFGRHLPAELTLGDPSVRDAAIHAIQACIPHRRLLPVGVDEIRPAYIDGTCTWIVHARERESQQENNLYVYDMVLRRADAAVEEQWRGLRLRSVEPLSTPDSWPEPLLEAYLERRLEELCGGEQVRVRLRGGLSGKQPSRSEHVLQLALDPSLAVHRRPDRKFVLANGDAASSAHAGDLTLAVTGHAQLACDVEPVVRRNGSPWSDVLSGERIALATEIARSSGWSFDAAATCVWTACECLKKAGLSFNAPLIFESSLPDGWTLLRSGPRRLASYATTPQTTKQKLMITVLVGDDNGQL